MIPGRIYKPEDFLRMAWRWKWLIVLPLVLVAPGTVMVTKYLPDRYRSETLILIVPQRVPEAYVRSTVTTRLEDRLQSISQQILSRTRLERVIQDFNLYAEERRNLIMEDVIEGMRSDINVEIVKGDAFRVSYISNDPRSAMKVTERLASLFIEENLRDREVLAEGTNQFLSTQLEDARKRLIEHEKKLEAYRRRFSGELPSQVEPNLQVIQNTQMQVQAIVESISQDRDRRLLLERSLAEATSPDSMAAPAAAVSPEPGIAPPAVGSIQQQLEGATQVLKALETRLKPEHPDVVRMKRLVADLQKKVEAEALTAPLSDTATQADPVDPTQRRKVQGLRAELEKIDRQIAQKEEEEKRLRGVTGAYQGRVEASLTRESELSELMRDYETLQKTYTSLLGKKEESQMAANLERRQIGEQFKMLDPARLPERPFSPNRPLIAGMGVGAGLGIGLLLAALLEYRDTSLKTDEDVLAALGLPVLAVVPVMRTEAERQRQWRRRLWVLSVGTAATVLSVVALVFWKLRY